MSFYCDWCGELIGEKLGLVTLVVDGNYSDAWPIYDRRRHFHAGSRADDDSCILRALAPVDEHRPKGDHESRQQERAARQADVDRGETVWKETSRERRETMVLQALGDERLVIREVSDRMNAELGFPPSTRGNYVLRPIYPSYVGSLVKRMWRQGQLEREPETFNKTHTRYRYFRKRSLDGPIADLERVYQDDETVT
jgi:hypothetical protein